MTVVEQVKSVCFSANIENREGLHQFTVLIRAGQAGQVARGRLLSELVNWLVGICCGNSICHSRGSGNDIVASSCRRRLNKDPAINCGAKYI